MKNNDFFIGSCSHAYFLNYVALYVSLKLEGNVINVRCHVSGCSGLLEDEDCWRILPTKCGEFEKLDADERWKDDVMLMKHPKDMRWRQCLILGFILRNRRVACA
ncbi:putative E3 ubiquitin ligase RBR family [Medicago truncatula]|uniref:Putative E3 ubiquitin ligase RBR family n=1 Tax=Medicago truncatula TaxID=3880 RepID=A0A396J6R1_MEDTR|nr:putative E3 ubiquitin ligase RBR family [Medicago truncatula]